jgi:hypothetical protein
MTDFKIVFDKLKEKILEEIQIFDEKILNREIVKGIYLIPVIYNIGKGNIVKPTKKNINTYLAQIFDELEANGNCFCPFANFITTKISYVLFKKEIEFSYYSLFDKDLQMNFMFLNMHYHEIFIEILISSANFLYKKLAEEKIYGIFVKEFFANTTVLIFDFIQFLPITLKSKYLNMVRINTEVLVKLKKPTYEQLITRKLNEMKNVLTQGCDLSFLRDIKQEKDEIQLENDDLCEIEVYASQQAIIYFEDYINSIQNRTKEIIILLKEFKKCRSTYYECMKMKQNNILSSFFEVQSIWEIQKIDIIHESIFGFKLNSNDVEDYRKKFVVLKNTLLVLTQRSLQN